MLQTQAAGTWTAIDDGRRPLNLTAAERLAWKENDQVECSMDGA